MRKALFYSLRGAIGFGIGLTLPALALTFFVTSYVMNLGAALLGGAIGAVALTMGTGIQGRAIGGFGCSFIPMWFMVLFTHISIQGGGRPDLGWGALGCGIGFAFAGAVGGLTLRPVLFVSGLITFGLAGALGGYLSFLMIDRGMGGLPYAMAIAGVVAGGLFGASIPLMTDE